MDQKIFFILLIVFLLTSEFYLMIRNICLYGFYLLVILYILKIISPKMSEKIKTFLNISINTDEKSIMKNISNIIKFIKTKINVNTLNIDKLTNLFEDKNASNENASNEN